MRLFVEEATLVMGESLGAGCICVYTLLGRVGNAEVGIVRVSAHSEEDDVNLGINVFD